MTIIVLDGPENVGKTTLAMEIVRQNPGARYRHWGPVKHDEVYAPALMEDIMLGGLVVWDRSWASEHVYSKLLNRTKHRLGDDPFLGEWLYTRAVLSVGCCFMVVGDEIQPHDEDDLPVDPVEEQNEFTGYALDHGWPIVVNKFTAGNLVNNSERVMHHVNKLQMLVENETYSVPPVYAGPPCPKVMFVGERRSAGKFPGAFIPFASRLTTMLGREIGNNAVFAGWTNVADVAPQEIRRADVVVSCGGVARKWVDYHVAMSGYTGNKFRFSIPHPAYLYRYNNERTVQGREEVKTFCEVIKEKLESTKQTYQTFN
jgi:hypothetical protein